METSSGKEAINVLRRLIAYSEKIFALSADILMQVSDRRLEPRISAVAVVKSALVLFWARMGSINAWAQVGGRARFGRVGWPSPPAAQTLWGGSMHYWTPTGCGRGYTRFMNV